MLAGGRDRLKKSILRNSFVQDWAKVLARESHLEVELACRPHYSDL